MTNSDEEWTKIKLAWAKGELIQFRRNNSRWEDYTSENFIDRDWPSGTEWRLKPESVKVRLIITSLWDKEYPDAIVQFWLNPKNTPEPKLPDCLPGKEGEYKKVKIIYTGDWTEIEKE
jgi:hypothetical protein